MIRSRACAICGREGAERGGGKEVMEQRGHEVGRFVYVDIEATKNSGEVGVTE